MERGVKKMAGSALIKIYQRELDDQRRLKEHHVDQAFEALEGGEADGGDADDGAGAFR